MKQLITESAIVLGTSLVLAWMLIPLLIKYSIRLGLVDKPNQRKVHSTPIPVVGGIALMICSMAAIVLTKTGLSLFIQYPVVITGSILLFVVGVWDDRKNLRPLHRLMLQVLCGFAIAASGIRLSSFYGIFGINELNTFWQYVLTTIIITGVTNAFNLMDGIDGLAGGLALINIVTLAVLSFLFQQYSIFILLVAIAGGLVAFLKFNTHPARIFMGDGGSLMLGFLMSSVGILLIEKGASFHDFNNSYTVLIVSAILIIPVFDSLRVYAGRIQRGGSPFKADKTHLHHLFLNLGFNHKKTAFMIYGLELFIIALVFLMHRVVTISMCFVTMTILFLLVSQLLQLNTGVDKWSKVIRKMEGSHS